MLWALAILAAAPGPTSLSEVMERTHWAFDAKDQRWSAPGVKVEPDGTATFAAGLKLKLERMCRGACLAPTVEHVTRGDDGALELQRSGGVTERFANGPKGVEQSFVVQGGPMCHGDLTLKLSARGMRWAGQGAAGHRFTGAKGARLAYGNAFVVRGAERIPVSVERTASGLRIRVPARLADAPGAWPMHIDPLIGLEQPADMPAVGPMPEATRQRRPRIASAGADSFYVVWEDEREGDGFAVWGTPVRIDPTGTVKVLEAIGERISPVVTSVEHLAPNISGLTLPDGTPAYWVTWETDTPQIYVRQLQVDGPSPALPALNLGTGRLPAVSCVRFNCLVSWTAVNGTAIPIASVQLQGRDGGGFVVSAPVSLGVQGAGVAAAAVPDLGGWAITWLVPTADAGSVFAMYVRADGGTYPSGGFPVATGGFEELGPPAIAYGSDAGALVAFTKDAGNGVRNVWFARYGLDAGVLDAPASRVGTNSALPAALWDGARYHLAWTEGFDYGALIGRATWEPGGTPNQLASSGAPLNAHLWPSLAFGVVGMKSHLLIAYEQINLFGPHDILLQDIENDAADTTDLVTLTVNGQGKAVATWAGDGFVGGWLDSRQVLPIFSLMAARYSADGTRVGPATLVMDAGVLVDDPAVGASNGQVLFVWKDYFTILDGGIGASIIGKRLSASLGSVGDPNNGFSLSFGRPVDFEAVPSIAPAGKEMLVTWSGDGGAWYRRLDADATSFAKAPELLNGNVPAQFPSAAFDGAKYVVAWQSVAPMPGILVTSLSFDGGTSVAPPAPLEMSLVGQYRPLVLSDGVSQTLVVWTQRGLGGFVLRGAVLDRSLAVRGSFSVADLTAPPELQRLSGAFDGKQYVVAYRKGQHLELATISATGAVLSPTDALGRDIPGRNPAVAIAPGGNGLLFYERFTPALGTTRTYLRVLGADAGAPFDGGLPDGGPLPVPVIFAPPNGLEVRCGQVIEASFTSDVKDGTWKMVSGPGRISNTGVYTWMGTLKRSSSTIVVSLEANGHTVERSAQVVVSCEDSLDFGSTTCGCSSAPLPLVPLLLFALARRRRRRGALLAALVGLVGCGRTAFYGGMDAPPVIPPPPPVLFCGDGVVTAPEACDDGDTDATDECLTDCTKARCGDGYVRIGVEACDDGNAVEDDACTSRCSLTSCGNGRLDPGEECDDANLDDTDACASTCLLAKCGDGKVFAGMEACDDGNSVNTDDCTSTCALPRCGDAFVHAGHEPCDDGNTVDDDFCTNQCKLPVCGDGKRAGAEQCDFGSMNGDRPAFLISQPSGTRIATDALVRAKTAVLFYDYRSASSHTGLEKVGESRIYLYVDSGTGRLSLVLTHGIDFDSSGERQPSSTVNMDITGLPSGVTLDVVDDPGLSPGEATKSGTTATGRWSFNQNSDGMVLGGLPFPGVWKVTVAPMFTMGITTWGWVKQDSVRIPLVLTEPITIEAFDTSTFCGTDCRVPRCGDGKFQGGEVCDDGNTTGGDGCAADCKSLK